MVHKMNTCFGYMINHTGYIADTKHKTIPDIRMIMGIIIWEKICSSSFTFFNLYLTSFYSFFTILTISRRLLPIRWQQSPAFQSYASIIECNRCHSLPKSTPPLFCFVSILRIPCGMQLRLVLASRQASYFNLTHPLRDATASVADYNQ